MWPLRLCRGSAGTSAKDMLPGHCLKPHSAVSSVPAMFHGTIQLCIGATNQIENSMK